MKCFTLTPADRVANGITTAHYNVSGSPPNKRGKLLEVSVALEVIAGLDNVPLKELIKAGDPNTFLYGVAYLTPPRKNETDMLPEGSLLVQIDMNSHFCDPSYGDSGPLVAWSGSDGLFLCVPGKTAIRNLESGAVFTNEKGVLTKSADPIKLLKKVTNNRDKERRKNGSTLLKV